jgi:hypothetical protein
LCGDRLHLSFLESSIELGAYLFYAAARGPSFLCCTVGAARVDQYNFPSPPPEIFQRPEQSRQRMRLVARDDGDGKI